MMRSLYSGVSGLKVHQTKMDVIGNNIANVNTIGFRASSVSFSDVFYQTSQNASGPNAMTGTAGTNAIQIGLGTDLASISVNLSGTGATERTERGLDLMINGDAFFIVNSNGANYFTKSGALDIDAQGTLYCKTNGATVMGWQVDENGEIRKSQVSPLRVMSAENAYIAPRATTAVTLSGNIDQNDPQVQFSPDAKGYPISVNFFDKLGEEYTAKFSVVQDQTDPAKYTVAISDITNSIGDSILKKYDETKQEYETLDYKFKLGDVDVTYTVEPATGVITMTAGAAQLVFDGTSGAFKSVGTSTTNPGLLNLNLNPTNNTTGNITFPGTGVSIDFSALTKYDTKGTSNVKPMRGDSGLGYGAGNAAGKLDEISVNTDGRIYGKYSNGEKKLLGQIAVANFSNPSGLEAMGNSLYAATQNSGDFDGIGIDMSEIGTLSVGALEMSNVDLSTEFTSMITTQRGFQANSRIITTSDTMLEELINLKR